MLEAVRSAISDALGSEELACATLPSLPFPKEVTRVAGDGFSGIEEFLSLLRSNRQWIEARLEEHGALLFRGTPVRTAEDFRHVVLAIDDRAAEYVAGARIRDSREKQNLVYAPASVPSYLPNQLHSEMAYQRDIPSRVIFFCQKRAPIGGISTLGNATKIYADLEPEVRKRFEEKGLRFNRRLMKRSPLFSWLSKWTKLLAVAVDWQTNFGTTDPKRVEEICKSSGQDFKWESNGDLTMSTFIEASRFHPRTREICWLNSSHLFQVNRRVYGNLMYVLGSLYLKLSRKTPSLCVFGDGSPIPESDIDHILDVLHKNTVHIALNPGDVVLVDNFKIWHGRTRFWGPRQLYFAMYR